MTKDKRNPSPSDSELNAAITQYEQASKLLTRGLSEQALDLFLQLIDRASWLIPAYSGAGAASLENGLFQQALDLVTDGLRVLDARGPDSNKDLEEELTRQRSLLLSQKATALSRLGQHRQAIELAQKSYEIFPSAQIRIELGNILAAAGKLDDAEEHYGLGLLETESPALAMIAYNNMAVLLEQQTDFDSALKCFQRASAINPNDSQAKIDLATALAERGHYDEAFETLFSISRDDSNSDWARGCEFVIRQSEFMMEMDDDLKADLEKQLAISPTALTYLSLALFYLQARQTITAIVLLQKGLALEPDNLALITTLTDTLLRKRLLQPAIPIVKEALITHPNNPQLTSLQTLILALTHEHSKAVHSFTVSIKLLSDKQTTFGEEPWTLAAPASRLLPSALMSYEYLIAAACEMRNWPLAIESLYAGLDLHLHHTLPPTRETHKTRLAIQEFKPNVLEHADPQAVAALTLILYTLNLQFHYSPLEQTIQTLLAVIPEAEEILNQMLELQSIFYSGKTVKYD